MIIFKVIVTIWILSGVVGLVTFVLGMSSDDLHDKLDLTFKISWATFLVIIVLGLSGAGLLTIWTNL